MVSSLVRLNCTSYLLQPFPVSATKTMQIQMIEQQILFLQQQLDALRQTHKKSKKKKKRSSKGGSGGASNAARRASKATGGESGTSKPPAPPRKKRPTSTEPAAPKPVKEITFEEKRELSEMINRLDGEQLNVVVQIIRESLKDLPNVCDSGGDIDVCYCDMISIPHHPG